MSNVDSDKIPNEQEDGTTPAGHPLPKSNDSNLGLKLTELKNKRKRVQQDVHLLHNRIRMLRLEEEKAMK